MLRTPPAPCLARETLAREHFLPSDRLPVPQPEVSDSEAAWAEFQQLMGLAGDGTGFAPTLPPASALAASSRGAGADAPIEPRPPEPLTVHDVMVEARRFNRVCPLPQAWQVLYEMLPGKLTMGRACQPPPPISGRAWHATSAMPKRMCLRDHIEWAQRQGVLEEVMRFLKSLPESQWHHVGDLKRD